MLQDAEKRATQGLLISARTKAAMGEIEAAKKDLQTLIDTYPMAKEVPYAQQDLRELNMIGQDAGEINAEKWFAGNSKISDGTITVLFFWEAWDPHSKREAIHLEDLYQKYKAKGLNLIGLTKVGGSATDESVAAFIEQHKLNFPIAKENEASMSKRYVVAAIPAAAMIKDGKIVWRGNPSPCMRVRRKRTPNKGMEPSMGTRSICSRESCRVSPAITAERPLSTVTVVVTSRLAMVGVKGVSVGPASMIASILGARIMRTAPVWGMTWGVIVSLMPTSVRSIFWITSREVPAPPSITEVRIGMSSTIRTVAS